MRKYSYYCLILFLLSNSVRSDGVYLVQKGDTLSEIVENITQPNFPLYGLKGRLRKIVNLNPRIDNPDLIYPGEPIYFGVKGKSGIKLKVFGGKPIKKKDENKKELATKSEQIVPIKVHKSEEGKASDILGEKGSDELVEVFAGLRLFSRRLDAYERAYRATALTDPSFGANFGFIFHYMSGLTGKVKLGIQEQNFLVDTEKISRNNNFKSYQLSYHLIKDFRGYIFSGGFNYERGVLLLANDINSLRFEESDIFSLSGSLGHEFNFRKRLKVRPYILVNYGINSTTKDQDINIDKSYSYSIGLLQKYLKSNYSFALDLHYKVGEIQVSYWSQKDQVLALDLILSTFF